MKPWQLEQPFSARSGSGESLFRHSTHTSSNLDACFCAIAHVDLETRTSNLMIHLLPLARGSPLCSKCGENKRQFPAFGVVLSDFSAMFGIESRVSCIVAEDTIGAT